MKDDGYAYAATLLDELVGIDREVTRGYYDMGRILHVFREDKLWNVLGYESWTAMVDEELSFSVSTACKYADTYKRFKELKYNQQEALDLIAEFSFTGCAKVLKDQKQKIGKRAMRNRLEEYPWHQLNFMLDTETYDKWDEVYFAFGGVYDENGHRENSREIFNTVLDAAMNKKARKAA